MIRINNLDMRVLNRLTNTLPNGWAQELRNMDEDTVDVILSKNTEMGVMASGQIILLYKDVVDHFKTDEFGEITIQ